MGKWNKIPRNKNTKYLERIPVNQTFSPSVSDNVTKNSKPIVLKQPGAAPLLQAIYPLPSAKHEDVAALDIMDYILAEGKNSRLYQALLDSGKASDVEASVVSLQDAGWYDS